MFTGAVLYFFITSYLMMIQLCECSDVIAIQVFFSITPKTKNFYLFSVFIGSMSEDPVAKWMSIKLHIVSVGWTYMFYNCPYNGDKATCMIPYANL